MLRRAIAACRRGASALGRAPTIVLCVAAMTVGVMYCSNNLVDDHPEAPRGDGRYRPVMARGDGHMHFLFTRSIVFDHDVNLDNDLARFGDPWGQPKTITGRKNVMQQIGPSLVWAPVLAAAHGMALVANAFGAGIETHGYTMFHQRILFATSVAFALLAIGLGIAVARRLLGGRWAPIYAGVAILFGSPLTYYATYMPSYAHAMDAAASASFFAVWVLTLGQLRWRRFVWLGLTLGWAMNMRTQDILLGVVLVLELGVLAVQRLRGDGVARDRLRDAALILIRGAVALGVALVLFFPQLYVWKLFYGSFITTPQGPGLMRWTHPMLLEALFASKNGWFSTHPLAYLGVFGLVIGIVTGPRLGRHVRLACGGLLFASAVQIYVNSVIYDYWGMASFGQRRMCSSSLCIVVGVAVVLRAMQLIVRRSAWIKHAIAIVVLGYFVAWNMSWVGQLRHAKTAGHESAPMCCRDVPAPLAWLAGPIHRAIGNPFALPASAWFAVRHGVELSRWDKVVGNYPLQPSPIGYIDGSYRRFVADWFPPVDNLLGGWGPPQAANKRRWRWTTAPSAGVMISLLLPEPSQITLPIAANVAPGQTLEVVVRCDGDEVARAQVGPTWTSLVFVTPGSSIGEREVTIEAAINPYGIPAGVDVPAAPPKPVPVGVAIGPFNMTLPPLPRPPP